MHLKQTGLILTALTLGFTVQLAVGGEPTMGEPEDTVDPSTLTREERIELRRQLQSQRTPEKVAKPDQSAAPAVTGEVPEELLDAILADLEGRTGVDRSAFTIRQAEAVTWNDGSLGCAEPGQVYTQALIRGYRVVIEHDGERNAYHAAANGYFKLCQGLMPTR